MSFALPALSTHSSVNRPPHINTALRDFHTITSAVVGQVFNDDDATERLKSTVDRHLFAAMIAGAEAQRDQLSAKSLNPFESGSQKPKRRERSTPGQTSSWPGPANDRLEENAPRNT